LKRKKSNRPTFGFLHLLIWLVPFAGSGISTDVQTSYAARIMAISVLPFVIAQFPKMLKTHHGERLAILLALIASFSLVLGYCVYQVNIHRMIKKMANYATGMNFDGV
jgi:hypothetical protein